MMTPDSTGDLGKLHDIALPAEHGWWPPAPGWIVLGLLLLLALVLLSVRAIRTWRANAYRREALAALDRATAPAEIAAVLRRTALAASSREEVAPLAGEAWTGWLAARFPRPLPESIPRLLVESPYLASGSSAEASSADLRRFASDWIRLHRSAPAS